MEAATFGTLVRVVLGVTGGEVKVDRVRVRADNVAPRVIHTRAIGTPQIGLTLYQGKLVDGPRTGGTVAQTTTANIDWTNATVSSLANFDGNPAQVVLTGFQQSEDLIVTNLGMVLNGAPRGIMVRVLLDATAGSGSHDVYLTKDGSTHHATKTSSGNNRNDTLIFGGPEDLWGISWTEAEVESANFGFIYLHFAGSPGKTIKIDRIEVVVYYDNPLIHTRAVGTVTVSYGATTIVPPPVVHTRAIGTPTITVPLDISPPSVIHTRGFGSPSVQEPSNNPDMKQGSISMQPWDTSTIEHDKVRPKQEKI